MATPAPPTPSGRSGLTAREKEYVTLVLRRIEPSAGEIATQMGIAPKTVEAHRANAYRKWRVHTRMELYYKAVAEGLVRCACWKEDPAAGSADEPTGGA